MTIDRDGGTAMTPETMTGYQLSAQQRRLWAICEPGTGCCVQVALRLEGGWSEEGLAAGLAGAVARHEILRTTFRRQPGARLPLQVIDGGAAGAALAIRDRPAGEDVEALLRGERAQPFDAVEGPLLRGAVTRTAPDQGRLVLTASPLCADLHTLLRLAREIVGGPQASTGGDGEEGSGEPLQYVEYATWQDELATSGDPDLDEGVEHWRRSVRELDQPLVLPWQESAAARKSTSQDLFAPATLRLDLDPELSGQVAAAALQHGAGVEDFLFAAWQLLIARASGADRFAVGRLHAGRKLRELADGAGPYAAYLPVRCRLAGRPLFRDLLAQAQDEARRNHDWEELGPGFMASLDEPPAELAVGFDFLAWPAAWRAAGTRCSVERWFSCRERFQLHLAGIVGHGGGLTLEVLYDAERFAPLAIRRLAESLAALLGAAARSPEAPAAALALLPPAERHRLLVELNDTGRGPGLGDAVHRRFEEQAALRPAADAVVCADRRLTFGELNARANQLARHLRALGVGGGSTVALWLDRSVEVLVCLLAVLKAGGAYVPLDPLSPRQRLGRMLAVVRPRAILTQSALAGGLPAGAGEIVRIDEDAAAIGEQSERNLDGVGAGGAELLYVLFTSGSTGEPKGVAVEHRQMLNYVQAILERLAITPPASFATVSTFAADLGHTAVFPALCSGGCLHVIGEEQALDPARFAEVLRRSPIDVLKIVPSHLASLMAAPEPRSVLPRRHLVLGGEACPVDLLARIEACPEPPAVSNHYGPTEATVGICTHRWRGPGSGAGSRVPLGRPLANCRLYVVDRELQPAAAGVPGELYLGGSGLARGYFGRPDATAERFVPDPFSGAGERLYRTGDLARLLPDGSLDFLGRIDQQHKIRGFRVETGEIEAVLRRHPAVRDAAVVVREDPPRGRRLVAYVVPRGPRAARPVAGEELRAWLREEVPEYMVPAVVATIASLPLTVNGKLNRAALPPPEDGRREARPVVGPRNPVEAALVRTWSEILRVQEIGIHHNFFELGGDSILAIQIISKARQAGLRLSPRQLFQHQTIAELGEVATSAGAGVADQEAVTGPVPLTPIQHWFFERITAGRDHWNQALAFASRQALDAGRLRQICGRLVEHHDVLRARYEPTPEGWSQRLAAPDAAGADAVFAVVDLAGVAEEDRGQAFTTAAAGLQASLDLARGPLLRVALFTAGPGWQRLLLFAHHLVVDGVSWRILLGDLEMAYGQLERGEPIALPPKTTSFKRWAEFLGERVRAGAFDGELDFWRSLTDLSHAAAGRADSAAGGGNSVASERSVIVALDAERTAALLHEVPAVYKTQINDVLLTALAAALGEEDGGGAVLIELEGHGREDLSEEIDLSRTVGWFTSRFPVLLNVAPGADPGSALRSVKEQLRRIPGHGLGYGVLRHLAGGAGGAALAAGAHARISFNYLGQLDQALAEESALLPAREHAGSSRSPVARRPHELEIIASVFERQLEARWIYSTALDREASIARLAGNFMRHLTALIEHCRTPGAGEVTAADFPLAQLDEDKLRWIGALLEQADGRPE